MKRPILGFLWAATAACLGLYFAYQMWSATNDATWQMNAVGLCEVVLVGLLGFMFITGWGFKKGYRTDVQCCNCYSYRFLPHAPGQLRCDECGNLQEDRPFIVDRAQRTA